MVTECQQPPQPLLVPINDGTVFRMKLIRNIVAAVIVPAAIIWSAPSALAIPAQGTPEFDNYMAGLERNGFHLNPDTAWRVAHQACEGGIPGYIGIEVAAQGVVGPGAQERLFSVARTYACPVK